MVGSLGGSAISQEKISRSRRVPDFIFIVFLRLLSLIVLAVGIFIWTRIIGLNGPDLAQIFASDPFNGVVHGGLAAVVPVLGVGLWLGMSWGLILWGLVGGGLIAAHFILKPLGLELYTFGASLVVLLAFYCVALLIKYLFLRNKG